ncbi:Lrp/AsnC family transcriptional regulator [Planomonospora sp. ID91781]|uniref:AsnC family transcriptional regulator n=3 Tax=Planomonospora TaxID=1998 RepID=A0A171DPW0_9ACTN|nr:MULTISPECIES: Lrp/AsnC family transcriptional regulator [Planomonospora]MBG0823195.1 Lrp/AsnC family transcriptional regulator [Planomonospora sp. ID91781]GAT71092.1 asnC family transcriptional regulator [Planomonospora sphaerica]GGK77104.1 AsnC family transcriptional regulator [Planomonospora parontospora]GII10045.1 AsnC family transcriptional regulator [Planomonospora parontospora subsp. parontospora]
MAARRRGLDDLDRRLLQLIRARPRTGLLEIARLLGVARGTVSARLDRMVTDGVITDFGPNLSPDALGYPVQAFTTLEVEQVSRAGISAALTAIPEVLEAHIVTGPGDVWCRIAGRDHEHVREVIDRALAIPGVRRSSTVIALSTVVAHRVQPLADSATAPDAAVGRSGPATDRS